MTAGSILVELTYAEASLIADLLDHKDGSVEEAALLAADLRFMVAEDRAGVERVAEVLAGRGSGSHIPGPADLGGQPKPGGSTSCGHAGCADEHGHIDECRDSWDET